MYIHCNVDANNQLTKSKKQPTNEATGNGDDTERE